MKVAVISSRYPNALEPYNHMFVHTRSKCYLEFGIDIKVFVPSRTTQSYAIDGVSVALMPATDIAREINDFDSVFVHLLHHSIHDELDGGKIYNKIIEHDIPCLFFIHGIEVQKIFQSRREDIQFRKPRSLARFLYWDFYVFRRMQESITKILSSTKNTRFVTVSKWMKLNAEESLKVSLDQKAVVIPNGIDTTLFQFSDHWDKRHKLLAIRPLILAGKYAIDLAIDTFKHSSAHSNSNSNSLTIYGRGPDRDAILHQISNSRAKDRIVINNQFIPHNDLPLIHKLFGIYFAVTRMDAQGVSMCEAMASGLPVISFATCAIPEFVEDGVNGLLVNNFDLRETNEKIECLSSDKNKFTKIAEAGRKSMEKIDIRHTCREEINTAKNVNS